MISARRVASTSVFSVGDICAAFYPKDQRWHRAVIERVYSTEKGSMVSGTWSTLVDRLMEGIYIGQWVNGLTNLFLIFH